MVMEGEQEARSGWVSSPCPAVNGALPKLEPKGHGLTLPTSLPPATTGPLFSTAIIHLL